MRFALVLLVVALAAGSTTLAFRFRRGDTPTPLRSMVTVGFFVIAVLLVGAGISGVIRPLVPTDDLFRSDDVALARALAYLAVGIPLGLGLWRQIKPTLEDSAPGWTLGWPLVMVWSTVATTFGLGQSVGWMLGGDSAPDGVGRLLGWGLVTITFVRLETRHRRWWRRDDAAPIWSLILPPLSIVSLAVAIYGIGSGLAWIAGDSPRPAQVGAGVAATVLWFSTYFLERAWRPRSNATAVGWGLVSLIAAVSTVGALLNRLFEAVLDRLTLASTIGESGGGWVAPILWAMWAITVWMTLWVRNGSQRSDTLLRRIFALGVGVTASALALITSAGTTVFLIAEWLIGSPETETARTQFLPIPVLVTTAIIAGGVLLHHRRLAGVPSPADRPARHVVAGAGLWAIAVGLASLVTAILVSFSPDVVAGDSGIDLVLGGLVAIATGTVAWWTQWRVLLTRTAADPTERSRPSRRIYLGGILAVAAVSGLVATVTVLFQIFQAILDPSQPWLTEALAMAVGTLTPTFAVGPYHLRLWKEDRNKTPRPAPVAARRELMIVTSGDIATLRAALAGRTSGLWIWRADDMGSSTPEAFELAVAAHLTPRLLLLDRMDGIEVIALES